MVVFLCSDFRTSNSPDMTDDIVEHFGQKFGQIHKVFLNPNTYYTAGEGGVILQ